MVTVANTIPTIQAVGLVSHNIKKSKKKNINTKDILSLGVTNIVGTSLIRSTAGMASGL